MTLALGPMEWGAFLSGLIYIYFAAQNDHRCWYWGILSCGLWMVVTFVVYDLYADGFLNLFYVIMGFIGLYQWKNGGSDGGELEISKLSPFQIIWISLSGITLSLLAGFFLGQYTAATATYWDSFTTVFSIIATFLLIDKKVENWPLWVIVNSAYIGLYFHREAWLFMILFTVYNILAIYGWYSWNKKRKHNLFLREQEL